MGGNVPGMDVDTVKRRGSSDNHGETETGQHGNALKDLGHSAGVLGNWQIKRFGVSSSHALRLCRHRQTNKSMGVTHRLLSVWYSVCRILAVTNRIPQSSGRCFARRRGDFTCRETKMRLLHQTSPHKPRRQEEHGVIEIHGKKKSTRL